MAMLTCYDYTTATHMRAAGVPSLLVGDSAASVVLGYGSTIPISLDFLIELTAAVRRGHPEALLVGDMPFGSYHESTAQGVRNVVKMVQRSQCDAVKLELGESQLGVVKRCADAGVAVIAHLGLRPQMVGVLGGYRTQGRTAGEADAIVAEAQAAEAAGAVAILLEAVPTETAERVVNGVSVPVIGCGAGPAVHGHVVVTNDLLGLTPHRPKFVPESPDGLDVAGDLRAALSAWVRGVETRAYPEAKHGYSMAASVASRPG